MSEDAARLFEPRRDAVLAGDDEALTALEMRVALGPFRGVAVTAPAQRPAGSALPIVVLSQRTVLTAWERPERYNLQLAVSGLDTGSLDLIQLLYNEKDDESVAQLERPRRPRPSPGAADALATKAQHFVVAAPAGRVAIAALVFDRASNVAVSEAASAPPRRPLAFIAPNPKTGAPTFTPPAEDTKPGLTFELRAQGEPNMVVHIRGRFSKPLAPIDQLNAPARVIDNGQPQQVVAIAPLHLVLMRLGGPARALRIVAPVYGEALPSLGQFVSGAFTVTLTSGDQLGPGAYAAFMFMAGAPYGPVTFEL
jgi:hypothetical protein